MAGGKNMENIPLPKTIKFEKTEEENMEKLVIEPCFPGYGITIGNALRRILLSSLPGAAVTAVKIKGVDHEFSTVKGIKEDMVEIILNLKQLRLKVHSDDPVVLKMKLKGEKNVKGSDFEKDGQVEIGNPDFKICTMTDKSSELDMEIVVQKGRGYIPTEAREKEKPEIGMILIDAVYTPVKNVGMKVENVRVAQATNYEKLKLKIETDGTITPKEAVSQSARILLDHFNLLLEEEGAKEPVSEEAEVKKGKKGKKAEEKTEEKAEETEETKE